MEEFDRGPDQLEELIHEFKDRAMKFKQRNQKKEKVRLIKGLIRHYQEDTLHFIGDPEGKKKRKGKKIYLKK